MNCARITRMLTSAFSSSSSELLDSSSSATSPYLSLTAVYIGEWRIDIHTLTSTARALEYYHIIIYITVCIHVLYIYIYSTIKAPSSTYQPLPILCPNETYCTTTFQVSALTNRESTLTVLYIYMYTWHISDYRFRYIKNSQ